jgi:hypothetical protein
MFDWGTPQKQTRVHSQENISPLAFCALFFLPLVLSATEFSFLLIPYARSKLQNATASRLVSVTLFHSLASCFLRLSGCCVPTIERPRQMVHSAQFSVSVGKHQIECRAVGVFPGDPHSLWGILACKGM